MADQKLLSVPHTLAEQKCLLKINTSTHLKVCYLFSLNNYCHTQQSTSVKQTSMVNEVIFFSLCLLIAMWRSEICPPYAPCKLMLSLGENKWNEFWVGGQTCALVLNDGALIESLPTDANLSSKHHFKPKAIITVST